MLYRLFIGILAALVAGCASGPALVPSAGMKVVTNDQLPDPDGSSLVANARPYLIGPFDTLEIDVFGIEALAKREVQTDASGRISFPLIGSVEAAGLTPLQLSEAIEAKLRGQFIRDPQVTVNLKETVSQAFTVDGEVEKPGIYPALGRITLLRAVATAGGTSEFAKLNDVVVFREIDGQRMAGLYNLRAIRQGTYDDPEIYANDVIFVGDSLARRRFKDLLQAAPLLSTPLIILFDRR